MSNVFCLAKTPFLFSELGELAREIFEKMVSGILKTAIDTLE